MLVNGFKYHQSGQFGEMIAQIGNPTRERPGRGKEGQLHLLHITLHGLAFLISLALHSKKKGTSEHLFWCFRLSQIEDSFQYQEGP